MKVIVGLGNPGKKYAMTRHNIGYRVVESFGEQEKAVFKKSVSCNALAAKKIVHSHGHEETILLIKPLLFMNNSGGPVVKVMKKDSVGLEDLLIVYDDVDLPLGEVRYKTKGGSGGHKGMASIIAVLGTQMIHRVRIGIDRPEDSGMVTDYVLSPFFPHEEERIKESITKAVSLCRKWMHK